MGNVHAKVESIGPEEANKYLDRMIYNRSVSAPNVSRLAESMRTGNWDLNGEPIILDENGLLIDGQHRLLAIIESKATVQMLVVRGVSKAAFDTIDTGKVRTGSDVLSILGRSEPNLYAAALRFLDRWMTGTILGRSRKTANHEIRRLDRRHPEMAESVAWVKAHGRHDAKFLRRGYMAFAHWAFHKAYPRKAAAFFGALASGENLDSTNAAFVLRRRLLTSEGNRQILDHMALAWTIKAWNAYVTGKAVGILRFKTEEEYPEIAGLPTPKEARVAIEAMRRAEEEAELAETNGQLVAVS